MNIATIWIQTKISRIMNIPQGYKQAELGIIPEDWEVKPFSQIFDIYPNNTYPRDCMNDSRGVVRNIHYGDVLIKYPTIVDAEKCAIPYLNEGVKIKLQKLVQSGDIIIADTAEDETVGKCVEIKNVGNNKIVAGLHTFFCRPTSLFAAGWLGYYINSTNYHNQLIPYITGIKVSSISRTAIQETKLLVPPIAEQRTIAEALSDVDGLIAALDKKIAKKQLLKQGAMQQLLTGKKRLPGFTDEWGKMCFKSIYKFASEGGTPDTKNESFYANGNIPFVKIEDTEQKYIYSGKSFITQEGVNHSSAWLIPTNSIIFTNGATIGNVAINKIPVTTKQGILGIILNSRVELEFVYYLLSSSTFQDEVNMRLSKGTFATIILKHLDEIPINIPVSLKEQQAIATILSDMDKEVADLEAQRDKYRLLKSGMMQKLLTGQIRLKNE